ncbi:MAG: acetyltransferase [Flavobacteriales bacterium]|nr:acetyltransferase [Flavobacteriales bacterium]
MTKQLIIFGTGDIAQIAKYYFERDTNYRVVAFTLDDEFVSDLEYEGLPVVGFRNIEERYSPTECDMFIALSYTEMNKLRERKFDEAKLKGFKLPSYVSPDCTFRSQFEVGDNCFIFEDNTIQPFVKIGNNVTLWSGNHIGHHSEILDHNFVSSHVVISGHCIVNSHCFLGVNSTLGHNVEIANETLVGAGAIITKNTEEQGVYVAPRSVKLEKKSNQFKL